MSVLRLPDGRVIEMVNDELSDDELLDKMEQDEYSDEYEQQEQVSPDMNAELLTKQIAIMGERLNNLHVAIEVAHNMVTALLIANGGKPVVLEKNLILAIVSEPRYGFDVIKNEDGSLTLNPTEISDEK